MSPEQAIQDEKASPPPTEERVIDPVCGMKVLPGKARGGSFEHGAVTYWFCNPKCRDRFAGDPEGYLAKMAAKALAPGMPVDAAGAPGAPMAKPEPAPAPAAPAATTGPQGAVYTCPMHPEIQQIGPGDCPLCGMALEPVAPTEATGPDPELVNMRRRLAASAGPTLLVVVLAMGPMVGLDLGLGRAGDFAQAALSAFVLGYGGAPLLAKAWASVRAKSPNMFTLIGIGVLVAFGFSSTSLLLPHALGHDTHGFYFEAAAVIVTLTLLGQYLELAARARTQDALLGLSRLLPKRATVVDATGKEHEVDLGAVAAGDRLRVRPGQSVPVDGEVLEGTSAVDASAVTGEPIPVAVGPGDSVTGGTLNQNGAFIMRATVPAADALVSRIVRKVAEAQRSRAPVQRVADLASAKFVPAVVLIALLAFAGWLAVGPEPKLVRAVVALVSVLIVACPCALGLATPMSMIVGMGRGARAGVLIRSAEALERLAAVDMVVFDKTGTLTEGRPRVVEIAAPGADPDAMLALAAAVEAASEHPLAHAVVARAKERGIAIGRATAFSAAPGRGARAHVGDSEVVVGSAEYVRGAGFDLEPIEAALQASPRTAIIVGSSGAVAAIFVDDPVKPGARAAVDALKSLGLRVMMLTGDRAPAAQRVAQELGIDEVRANVLPDEKGAAVAELRKSGRVVAMLGDGINDALALARADVGVAMGGGTDVAESAAAVTLFGGDLGAMVRAVRLSRATLANVKQNLLFAFGYNALAIPLAAGLLYPFLGVLMSPMIASALMSLSSVSVIGNALRLRHVAL